MSSPVIVDEAVEALRHAEVAWRTNGCEPDWATTLLAAAVPFLREQFMRDWGEAHTAGAASRQAEIEQLEASAAEWRAMAERLAACYEAEETEHGFPFSFELRHAHRALRALLDKETKG